MVINQNKAPLTAADTVHRRSPSCTVSKWILYAETDQNQTSIKCLISGELWGWYTMEIKTSLEAFKHIAYCNEKAFHATWIISRSSKPPCKPPLKCQSQYLVKRDTANAGKIPLTNSPVKPPSPRYWFSYINQHIEMTCESFQLCSEGLLLPIKRQDKISCLT